VEGYAESIATGLIAGRNAAGEPAIFPRETALGSLCHYITRADSRNFQPANITFDLLPALDNKVRDKKTRHAEVCRRAERAFEEFLDGHDTRVCCEVSG
jgi:methylenetetrahydrofolate--tRNA-(uracil-5-)-methyltransferase